MQNQNKVPRSMSREIMDSMFSPHNTSCFTESYSWPSYYSTLARGSPSHTESKVIIQPDPDHSDADKGVKKSICSPNEGCQGEKRMARRSVTDYKNVNWMEGAEDLSIVDLAVQLLPSVFFPNRAPL